ncbi:hypothetical protein F3Y22_tig00109908pilonHSYRG00039 [Hibiscus syriacus]|uniref:Uncharacterized protein n=1 Tax=Hibiscus syriacus TaxID=106335 RepID=A0A6A3BYV0_HIBSY|nr:hypothetical protein F3Y22_tig00109908pilonHSYRG00039 [Hibiscus syriacus]
MPLYLDLCGIFVLKRANFSGADYNPTGLSSFTLVNLFLREFGYTAFNTIGGYLQDELESTSNALGQRGGYDGTIVLVRNKATGELIAKGMDPRASASVMQIHLLIKGDANSSTDSSAITGTAGYVGYLSYKFIRGSRSEGKALRAAASFTLVKMHLLLMNDLADGLLRGFK